MPATAVVDIGHGAGYGSGGRDAAEEGRGEVGQTLSDELGIGVMVMAYHTVGYRGREQALYGAEDGNGKRRRHQALDDIPRQGGHGGTGQFAVDREAVAYGLYTCHAIKLLEYQSRQSHHDDSHQRARNLLAESGRERDNHDAHYAHHRRPPVYRADVMEVGYPLLGEVRRYRRHSQTQQVLDLGGKDGYGDTARKSHDDRIGYILDDCTQAQHTEEYQEHACHECSYGESLYAVLLYDAVDDDNESTCRSAYLHAASAEDRYHEASHDGGDDALLGRYARSDTKGDGQRQGYDAHDDAGHEVLHKFTTVIVFQGRNQFGFVRKYLHKWCC